MNLTFRKTQSDDLWIVGGSTLPDAAASCGPHRVLMLEDACSHRFEKDLGWARAAPLADPFQPAVMRMLRETVQAGRQAGIGVCLCGELAADTLATPVLIGMGLEEFSVSAKLTSTRSST